MLPVSDEMDCRACHASGTQAAAKPAAGWVWDGIPERDFRLNILRLHDEKQFASNAALYAAALAARGFNPQGLYRGVVADSKPVLCAACHASEALGAPSYGTIPPLTASVHGFHAHVMDPGLQYHARQLREPLGLLSLPSRLDDAMSARRDGRGDCGGWFDGNAMPELPRQHERGRLDQPRRLVHGAELRRVATPAPPRSNNGQIRYTSVFTDTNGTVRVPVNQTFATQPNTPAHGLSLYRFSAGHGGLQCEACHGSTHAEFPSTHANDNVRNIEIQGHAGVMVECTACHVSMSVSQRTAAGGPHGMHPVGQSWVSATS